MREFKKWAPPEMVVVPYVGDAESRKIIAKYELLAGDNLRAHVVVTTFEVFTNNRAIFAKVPRFDCMVIDEGQRLKGGEDGKRALESGPCAQSCQNHYSLQGAQHHLRGPQNHLVRHAAQQRSA